MLSSRSPRLAWCLVFSLLAACGDESSGSRRTATQLTSEEVGASGGTLTAAGGVQVQVPADALSGNVTIVVSALEGVRAPAGTAAVGTPLRLEPAGTTFEKPVAVTIPISPSSLADGGTLDDVVVLRSTQDSDVFVPLPTRRAASGNAVVAVTEHFSDFVPVVITASNNPFGSCGDSMCIAGEDETCSTCPSDCGVCVGAGECGNGICEVANDEYCGSCEFDCGQCAAGVCGDGIIDANETCDTGLTTGTPEERCLCDDGDACTDDMQIAGTEGMCNVVCSHQTRMGYGISDCDDSLDCTLDVPTAYEPSTCTLTCSNTALDLVAWSALHCDDMDPCTLDTAIGYDPLTCATSSCSHEAIGQCVVVCGDGYVGGSELCDDGNGTSGDGCSATCTIEGSYSCPASGGPCWNCGDGILQAAEACDEGVSRDDVGCESDCTLIGSGYACPGVGMPCLMGGICGDGVLDGAEACDDGVPAPGDGCDASCQIESGYSCPLPGMACYLGVCGDGQLQGFEGCDDANTSPLDGCASDCLLVEPGYVCSIPGMPCGPFCGDGIVIGGELCDDFNSEPFDGCDEFCGVEEGYTCPPSGGMCTPDQFDFCGDGLVTGAETCDDANASSTDGCSSICEVEPGFQCAIPGQACTPICGDSMMVGYEECDDGNPDGGDGCDDFCLIESGYTCPVVGQPCTML